LPAGVGASAGGGSCPFWDSPRDGFCPAAPASPDCSIGSKTDLECRLTTTVQARPQLQPPPQSWQKKLNSTVQRVQQLKNTHNPSVLGVSVTWNSLTTTLAQLQPQSLKTRHVTLPFMCGIFAYMGNQPIPITQVIQALHQLEAEQEMDEPTPVGGHGAGMAYQNPEHEFTLVKVGKTKGSPVNNLKRQLPDLTTQSTLILGHVRRASPQFLDTISHTECTQPYKPRCAHNLNILSAHNGYLENYQQLKTKLQAKHHFESEPIKLIDSEIIPHQYEEQLAKTQNPTKAAHAIYEQAEGRNTIIILHKDAHQAHLNIIQKGKTRGLTIWTNQDNAILLCSREKPIQTTFNRLLREGRYQEITHLTRNEAANLEAHFTLNHRPT